MINPLLVIRQSLPWRERAALRGRVMANGEGWDFRMTSDEACQVFIWGYLRQSGRHWLAALLQAPRLVPRNMYALAGDTFLRRPSHLIHLLRASLDAFTPNSAANNSGG